MSSDSGWIKPIDSRISLPGCDASLLNVSRMLEQALRQGDDIQPFKLCCRFPTNQKRAKWLKQANKEKELLAAGCSFVGSLLYIYLPHLGCRYNLYNQCTY